MSKLKKYFKSIQFSFKLVYRSTKLLSILNFAVRIFESTLDIVSAYILKYLLDGLTYGTSGFDAILFLAAMYILILVLNQALRSVNNISYDTVLQKTKYQYDCDVIEKMSRLPLSVIDSSNGRDMLDDIHYSKNFVMSMFRETVLLITNIYKFVIVYTALFKFNAWFSFLFLLLTVPGIVLDLIFEKRGEKLRMEQAPDVRKFSYYRWMLTDSWPAKDVRMYDLTDHVKSRYDETKNEYIKTNKKLGKKKLYASLLAEVIRRSGEIGFIIFVIYEAINGKISIGDIALYTGFALQTSDLFELIVSYVSSGYSFLSDEICHVLDFFAIETAEDKCGGRTLDEFESLTFDNVYFKYPYTENYVLSGTSFTLNRGDRLSIVGINGSGKSTIIKLMLGLYEIESGQILINGFPMSDYSIHDVHKLFSALFQSFVQYPLTLRENVALSSLEKIQDSGYIEKVLSQSGVYEDIKPKLENGLDSYMTRQFDDKGTELSKGQWQKIALSRAYFKDAPVIIFDEPSAALDAEAEDRIFRNFEAIADGKTGIMISHRISSSRMSNKIVVLDGGKITEQGTHEELLELGGLYAKMYSLQREKYTIQEKEA